MKTGARVLLTLILVAAGCVGGYERWNYYFFSPWTRDARVQADVVSIAPDVSGFVDEVRVKDNQFVHKGDILVVLDRSTAQLNLDRTILRAPVNGFITNLTLEVGQYASVGTKIMALLDSDSYRVTAYFEEIKIPAVHLGEVAKIYLLNGSPALRGHVQSVARGITDRDNTGGPELLVNPNPTFEWVRLAQRIPVRIHIDEVPEGVLISSGMTCTVDLEAPPRQWAVLAAFDRWLAAAR